MEIGNDGDKPLNTDALELVPSMLSTTELHLQASCFFLIANIY
jgi:hypothetical protein